MKRLSFRLIIGCLAILPESLSAQTGPGGVGDAATNKIWLDASHMTNLQNNDAIQTWYDRSGNNWHANQPNPLNRPTYQTNKLNSRPVIHFDRTTAPQFVQVTSPGVGAVMSGSQTIFAVSRASTAGAGGSGDQGLYQLIFTTGAGWISGMYYIGTSTIRNEATTWLGGNGDLPTISIRSSASVAINAWNISTQWVYESASSTNLRVFFNGAPQGNTTHGKLIANYTNYDKITLGAYAGSGWMSALNGDIAEAIFYNTTLNDAQRIIVDNYLSAKYNLSVSNDYYTGHHLSYVLDVQGIGTTNGTAIQKYSHAGNSKGLLLTELNNSLNATNEFLFAGHGPETNKWVADPDMSGYSHWDRAWYLRKNGSIDAKLSFDFSQTELFPEEDLTSNLSSYRLLYRSALDLPFTVVQVGNQPLVPTIENNDQLAFNLVNSQLVNGYYTLGHAASLVWTGAVNSQWDLPGNWNMSRVPTANDFVHINECTVCPILNNSVTIAGLTLNNESELTLTNSTLSVSGAAYFSGAAMTSQDGQIKAADFAEMKNSTFKGSITFEKTGGGVNTCYGGNTISQELKFINGSLNNWHVAAQANNIVTKIN